MLEIPWESPFFSFTCDAIATVGHPPNFFLVSFTYATGQLPSSQSWLFYLFQVLFYGYSGVISDGQIVGFVSIMWETGIGFLAPSFICCPAPVTAGIWKVNPWIGICVFSFSWVIHEWLKIKKKCCQVYPERETLIHYCYKCKLV